MGIAGAASALIGYATLRLRADYLAIATFGVAVTIHLIALNARGLTGGPYGVAFVPRPLGDLADRPLLFDGLNLALVAALALVLYVALERLARRPGGRALRAMRAEQEEGGAGREQPR